MQLDGETGLGLIIKALEQERDERFFLQWAIQLPHMGEEHYISFADYKDRLTGANIDRRPVAEILAELDEVERRLQKGGGN
jgi:hypothetical protein